jgi:lipoprotein-anchoring transpeptidase ErfK/SrfK
MRTLFRHILALLVLAAAPAHAYAHVEINIDLTSQTMTVHSGTGETFVWPISSGRAGYATPRGVFHPRALYVMVHSAKYGNAPMPHSIFFYGQYAIHGTNAVGNLGRPASHGCVRISPGAAATLFAMVQRQGAEIRIVGSPFSDEARGERRSGSALAFAPIRHTRTLKEWARDPLAQ